VSNPIQVGDVCLDLTQGRPVHVVEDLQQTAAEWSDANNYELCENYGNDRLGASDDDAVYEVVYCSSAKSEPSKTYAMPESRLLRVETESADDGRPVADRVAVDILTDVFGLMERRPAFSESDIEAVAGNVDVHPDAVDEARELADVELTIGGVDDD